MKYSTVLLGAALSASTVLADVDPIVIKGSKFFYKSNGTEFFMRGIAYQQEYTGGGSSGSDPSGVKYVDPLADPETCKRDIPYLVALRTNTIRTYAINPEADHDECMEALQDAGIYVVSDLSSPGESINRDDPSWDIALYKRYTSVVDALSKYNNVIGFFAGNEVSNNYSNTNASAYVKAAVRDTKAYIKSKNLDRELYVGYATNDDEEIRQDMAAYFNCGERDDSIDFWGYNVYSWCGDSTYEKSGFKDRTEEYRDYSVPVFFAEYGCNEVQPRKFTEVKALYGPEMTKVWSGGIVYMYFQEANDYGLVTVKGDEVSKLPDFTYLSKQIASVNPTGVKMDDYTPTNTALSSCPSVHSGWQSNPKLPPSPNEDLCKCMVSSLSCKAKDNLSDKEIAQLFGTVCGYGVCDGISGNAREGEYGAYSMCSPKDKLSFAINVYYQQQVEEGNGDTACDFDGAAELQDAEEPSGTCASLLEQAGPEGTGTVSSSSSSSDDADESEGAASHLVMPASVRVGLWQVGAYLAVAAVTGVGMIVL
ncbi:hypothetical protein VTN31DRAFT_1630 [Thermomyces dupontii]|uniref:uncharacterized protein n=1 Tax=Talaromyces thermophilus TaxID=28565 RepID=UPI003742F284